MANMFDGATGWSVSNPLTGATIGGGTFGAANFNQRFGNLPDATIAQSGWSALTAQTPGGTPNPVAALSGLGWPSPGAVGVAPGTSGSGSDLFQNATGITFKGLLIAILGLVFIGGGVSMFGRK